MESFGSKSNGAKPPGFPERASDEPGLNGPEKRLDDTHGQIVTCSPDQLRPHPSYVRHQLTVPAHQLSTLASSSDLAFQDPLVITRDLLILDGYARWELARKQGRPTLLCIAYDMTEADTDYWLVKRITDRNGNYADFTYLSATVQVGSSSGTRKVVSQVSTSCRPNRS